MMKYGHEMWTQADRIRKGVVRNPFEKTQERFEFTGYGYCCNLDKNKGYHIWNMENSSETL